nr:metalloprotease TIKI2-like [Meriones unguiculatus]
MLYQSPVAELHRHVTISCRVQVARTSSDRLHYLTALTCLEVGYMSTGLIDTGCVLFALNQTLLQHESVRAGSLQAPYTTEDLIKHYNCGDLNAVIFNHDTSQLPNFINTTLPPHEQVTAQEIDSYFRQELIYKRNERMGRRVMALLRENQDKICFFAFGAGHFLGNNTVIDVLRQAGLEVDHTPAGQAIQSPAAGSPAPSPEGTSPASPAPATPAAAVPEATSATPTAPPEEEDPVLSPHLLLPDSLSQLEEFGRQKWRKRLNKHQRPRQFNDLWVRIEESTTISPPPLPLQPTPSSGTTKPFAKSSHQLQQQDPVGPTRSSAPTPRLPPVIAATIVAPFLLYTLGPS